MITKKKMHERGKISLSKYFQKFDSGEFVAIKKEPSVYSTFPLRMQGRTGVVAGKRGRSYIVKIKDNKMEKSFIIEPVHLHKIKVTK